ncbi:LOW QUALITY PROTEIN: DUF789 domain-containing protein, partial [Cephalotus follicularis]
MSHVLHMFCHASIASQAYAGFGLYHQPKFRHVASGASRRTKWVPVGTKKSSLLEKTVSTDIYNGSFDSSLPSCNGEDDCHQIGQNNPLCRPGTFSDSTSISFVSSQKMTSTVSEASNIECYSAAVELQSAEIEKNTVAYGRSPKNTSQLTSASDMAIQALTAAYKWQLASEDVELAISCPIAFERLIYSFAPVIGSLDIYKECDIFLVNKLFRSLLCEHQIPNLSLRDVWNWYEKPGNYRLEVKAEDFHKVKGLLSDPISHAYFVPFLSAVQLLGYPHLSNCCEHQDSQTLEGEVFHDQEPPRLRPLPLEIMELINAGTSNLQVFGDPLKLESLNLNDLHPASWFSVAWYPIHIPEGNLRASFLTFHSLGHLVEKCVATGSLNNKVSSIVAPVLGLQSYNAKGEFWFDLKRPVESSLKESSPFNGSKVLEEQLKTLEENASLFARGCVYKTNAKVFNRHPDYEF